ncbi:hypothetical protein [Methylacidiphilum caldifontis]|uniref:Uncharacterized protein n=1 Tax=Methylacidiphilum caldifontis TaxID=2795386 RepID=A0A4Y8PBA0_9BACT|nr:hypothetical protein [Methylacidiphilum caldifontis]TFE68232.1 hypothetical protein A7Q10_00910 [Methylacidiphilum caldifontis]
MDYKHFQVKITATEGGNYHLNAQFHPLWHINKKIDFDNGLINWKTIAEGASSLHSCLTNLFRWAKEIYELFQPFKLKEPIEQAKEQTINPIEKNFSKNETEHTEDPPSKKTEPNPIFNNEPQSQQKIAETSNTAKKIISAAKDKVHKKKPMSKTHNLDIEESTPLANFNPNKQNEPKACTHCSQKKESWSLWFGFSIPVHKTTLSERKKDNRTR